jgi:hypothetical protein
MYVAEDGVALTVSVASTLGATKSASHDAFAAPDVVQPTVDTPTAAAAAAAMRVNLNVMP